MMPSTSKASLTIRSISGVAISRCVVLACAAAVALPADSAVRKSRTAKRPATKFAKKAPKQAAKPVAKAAPKAAVPVTIVTAPVPPPAAPVAPSPPAEPPVVPPVVILPEIPTAPVAPAPLLVPVAPSPAPLVPVAPPTAVAPAPEAPPAVPLPVPPGTPTTSVTEQATALRGLGEVRRRQLRYQESADFFRRATLLDPADVKARVGLAQALRGQRRFPEALVECEQALTLAPTDLSARVVHAQLLGDNNRADDAAKELDALVASLPEKPYPETYVALGQAFVMLKNYDAALALLGRGKEDWPQDVYVARNNAEVLTYAKRWNDAEKAWDALIAADAKDADAVLGKARVFNYSSREEQAEPLYIKALQIEPENYQAQIELADILGRRGKWKESVAAYRAALDKNTGDLPSRVEMARVLRYDGKYDEAESELAKVLATDARFAPALTERGIVRGQNKKFDLAIIDLEAALKLTPDDVFAQFGLAEVLGYNKQYDESIALYRKALEKEPESQKGRVELGLVLSYSQQFPDAIREFDIVLKSNPKNVNAQIGKADTLARMTRYAEAVALYNTILAADPENRRANTGLAEAYVYAKDYLKAMAIYDKLIAANPGDVNLAIDRGQTLGYAGMHRASVAALQPIVAANPGNMEARFALAEEQTNSGDKALREQAIGNYRTILKADANNLDARFGLGRVLSYQGKSDEAEIELTKVAMARPKDANVYYALAEVQRYKKPFDAEDNFQRGLKLGPKSVSASRAMLALADLQRQTGPDVGFYARRYSDTNGVRISEVGGGPTFRTRAGTFGINAFGGRFTDDGVTQNRRGFSLLAGRNFGSLRARLLLHRVEYALAPDRNLYDLLLEKRVNARKRYYVSVAKQEVDESLGALTAGVSQRQIRAGVDWAPGPHWDAEIELRQHSYSDGNRRFGIRPSIYYRLTPTAPSVRFGLGYTRDNTRLSSPAATPYYTPQDYSSFALLADYVKTEGRSRYGIFAAHPLTSSTGIAGLNRPADTLFGFAQYDLNAVLQLFIEGGVVSGPNFDSTTLTGGLNWWF